MGTMDELPVPSRYVGSDMLTIWPDTERYRNWASVEIVAAKAQGAPSGVIALMGAARVPTPAEVAHEEATTGHDVAAFLAAWKKQMDPTAHEWVHRNMTSSDLVDSALAINIANSRRFLLRKTDRLIVLLIEHALTHQHTHRLGRTHGQVAEVTTWGYRVADIVHMAMRSRMDLDRSGHLASRPKLSGPVGNYRHLTREQEIRFAELLMGPGATPAPTATQVVARDALASFVFACAKLAAVIEALALEVRLSMRSDVQELSEGGTRSRVGSSAMPHKRNPIISENLTGLARLVRAQVGPMMEDIALHHERDITHSSVERVALPTAVILTDFMLGRACDLVANLEVDAARMQQNIWQHEAEINSATARNWLVEKGMDPTTAWELVRVAVDQANEDDVLLADSVAKVARRFIRDGLINAEFNANWVELKERTSTVPPQVDHVFESLRLMVKPRKFPEFNGKLRT